MTFGHKRSCDSVTGGPTFPNLMTKYSQDLKKRSHEAVWLKARWFCVRGKICIGGPPRPPPPPPPVQLGLRSRAPSGANHRKFCMDVKTHVKSIATNKIRAKTIKKIIMINAN